ncbi:MAG: ECF transporter S component [bacterium]
MRPKIRNLTVIAVFSTLAFLIMLLEFSLPVFPPFLKFDFSDLPALLVGLWLGPLSGIMVVMGKNILHLFVTATVGIGELANFLIGASLTASASYLFTKKGFTLKVSLFWGGLAMILSSVFVNYFLIIPLYEKILKLPLEQILELAARVNPYVDSLFSYLLLVIIPFNLTKMIIIGLLTYLLYMRIKPILKKGGYISE